MASRGKQLRSRPWLDVLEDRINCAVHVVRNALDYDPNYDLGNQDTWPIANSLRAHLKTAMENYIVTGVPDTIVFNTNPAQGTDFSQPQAAKINLKAALGGDYHGTGTVFYDPIEYPVVIQGPRMQFGDPSLPLVEIVGGGTSWKNVDSGSPGYGSDWSVIQIANNIGQGRVSLEGLKITGGKAQDGAGIWISARGEFEINITQCDISGNVSHRRDSHSGTQGAGIWMIGDARTASPAKLTIFGSIIHNNSTDFDDSSLNPKPGIGGGLWIGGGTSLVMSATIVEKNQAENGAGGLYFVGSQFENLVGSPAINSTQLRITACVFSENAAVSARGSSWGGAILMGGSMNGLVSDTTFAKNLATGSGGAVAISDGDSSAFLLVGELDFVACTFYDNVGAMVPTGAEFIATSFGSGGALHVNTTANRVYIVNSTFSNNRVDQGEGGAIAIQPRRFDYQHRLLFNKNYDNRLLILDQEQTIDPPESHTEQPSFIEITNCTIADNFAGGIVVFNDLSMQLESFGSRGGGIAIFPDTTDYSLQGTVRIYSTIVAKNTIQLGLSVPRVPADGSGPDIWIADDTVSTGLIPITGTHNLVGVHGSSTVGSGHFSLVGQTGTLAQPLDPLLGLLANNGGLTMTRAITPESPAYDMGAPTHNNGSDTPYMTYDQRFGARIVHGKVDVGAFEWQLTVKSIKIDNGDASYGSDHGNEQQRSQVRRIIVTFSEPVTFTGASAFQLHRDGPNSIQPGADADVSLVISPASGLTDSVTITFASNSSITLEGDSIPDGLYDFTIIAANVTAWGVQLNGNWLADGTDYVIDSDYDDLTNQPYGIWRLFGDGNGTGTTDLNDYIAFRALFNLGANATYDFDNDGNVGISDYIAFRARFNMLP